ncbi:MAG TPA: threonine synthase [Alphaproteobacteria bacterium]|nr:threonine synthase [Alphaproteobacteria bacterium]HNS44137.1 threonine synthase [Alphaproteobacteria bacterium]
MRYHSTRGGIKSATFTEVLLSGLAPDGGLFVSEHWPILPPIDRAHHYTEIALKTLSPFMAEDIPVHDLKTLIDETYAPSVWTDPDITPLKPMGNDIYLMELFHGPTLAFKDVALQFLGRLFDYILEKNGQQITIIGATSGDTGSAAIEACKNRKNISITILHPKGRTSDIQRRQMTSVQADNVHNIAVEGTFDDCQNLVKQAFADEKLRKDKNLSAVNSINWARIIAQTVYYIDAAKQLGATPAFAVPTGNFGNIYAAWVGKQMGGKIGPLVIGSNRNDILTRFFETGEMKLGQVTPSHSPSMDIQISSNFERFLFDVLGRDTNSLNACMSDFKTKGSYALDGGALETARKNFIARRCSDEDTVATIARVYQETGMIIDPHTAVGVHALHTSGLEHSLEFGGPCVALACAHPAKFPDVVEKATGIRPALPDHLADLMDRPEKYDVIPNDFAKLKEHLESV